MSCLDTKGAARARREQSGENRLEAVTVTVVLQYPKYLQVFDCRIFRDQRGLERT